MTQLLMVCGVGGAGKTTLSASLAIAAARSGQRVLVVTIDPAKRLADALGLRPDSLKAHAVALPAPCSGHLEAMMLDRQTAWDAAVQRHAPTDEVARALLANPYYRALRTSLTGGHEYVATEMLHALHQRDDWDLIVVDTPPARHALDVLEAPARVQQLLDRKLVALFLGSGGGLLGAATRGLSGIVQRLAGRQVIADLNDFFDLLHHVSEGFRQRGREVENLLRGKDCSYILVADAAVPRFEELAPFVAHLQRHRQHIAGFILNRWTPTPAATLLGHRAVLRSLEPSIQHGVETEWHHVEQHASACTRTHQRFNTLAPDVGVWHAPHLSTALGLETLVEISASMPPLHPPTQV